MTGKITPGKLSISLVAVFTAVSPSLADFNATHVYNPAWPGHARFHNGQTMTLGPIGGIISLYFLWFKETSTEIENLKVSCLFAALYWMAIAPAILYPGATMTDPELGGGRRITSSALPSPGFIGTRLYSASYSLPT